MNGSFSRYSTPSPRRQSPPTFPSLVLSAIQFLLEKLGELIELSRLGRDKSQGRPSLITISDKKATNLPRNSESSSIPPIRSEIQGMLGKLEQFKMSEGLEKLSWSGRNHFEVEETEINLVRVEEELKREIEGVAGRVRSLEEDMGEMLVLYKNLIFDR